MKLTAETSQKAGIPRLLRLRFLTVFNPAIIVSRSLNSAEVFDSGIVSEWRDGRPL